MLHQLEFSRSVLDGGPGAHAVMWLPQYHDFGLISGILSALLGNWRLTLLSPLSFIKRPRVWFDTIHRVRATHTAAPDFGYALAARKIPAELAKTWDLSGLRVAMSAAEPIRADTLEDFVARFADSGFAWPAFCPAYGLAEHTVGVTVGGRGFVAVSRASLAHGRIDVSPGDGAVLLARCGRPANGIAVRIVDPVSARPSRPEEVGEIWVHSESVALGYWRRPEETARTFGARLIGDGSDWGPDAGADLTSPQQTLSAAAARVPMLAMTGVAHIEGITGGEPLRLAVQRQVDRLEGLRLRVHKESGRVAVRLHDQGPQVEVGWSYETAMEPYQAWCQRFLGLGLGGPDTPGAAFALCALGPRHHAVALNINHLLMDAIGQTWMMRLLADACAEVERGEAAAEAGLRPIATSHAAILERERVLSPERSIATVLAELRDHLTDGIRHSAIDGDELLQLLFQQGHQRAFLWDINVFPMALSARVGSARLRMEVIPPSHHEHRASFRVIEDVGSGAVQVMLLHRLDELDAAEGARLLKRFAHVLDVLTRPSPPVPIAAALQSLARVS